MVSASTTIQWWRIGRASLGYILDNINMSRGPGDIIDPLILSAIVEANIALINQDPELQRRYASLDQSPPDELRRPVSVSAVAASLRLPYETVRRRVARLAENGACTLTPRGVMVPSAILDGPFYRVIALARYERLKRFYFDVKALGALATLAMPADPPTFDDVPVRSVNRAISEYMLRVIDGTMRRIGDPLTGLILLEMARANAEHLPDDDMQIEGPTPDLGRRPVRTLVLAKRLGLPSETVRRHVARLEKGGFCRQVDGGRLAALEQLGQGEEGGHGLAENLINVQRLFSRLATLGVLAYWEAEGR
ncbi:MAG: ArsR family transcriptional regulator [Phenylobacterium sp.]|nr:MAG: ArsR family transcriptional regulator [Phenylobacterium sp.]